MSNTRSIIFITIMLILSSFNSHAQNDGIMHIEKRYSIYFRLGKSEIDHSYLENIHVIETMISDISATLETEGYTPDSLLIYASASPEGSAALNERLAQKRAMATKDFILRVLPQLKDAKIDIESRTNDWSGVLQAARADQSLPYREEIIKVLADSRIADKNAALHAMPQVFEYILDNMLNKMRTATVTIRIIDKVDEFAVEPELHISADSLVIFPAAGDVRKISYQKSVEDNILPTIEHDADWIENVIVTRDSISITALANPLPEVRTASLAVSCYGKTHEISLSQDAAQPVAVEPKTVVEEQPVEDQESEKKPYYLAVKNNMLYDLVLVPNIGLDIYLGKNLSLSGNWMYAWWKDDNIHWYWRTYGGDLGIRYWFGKAAKEKPLQGHHVGLYGQIVTYDFELGGRGYLSDRWTYGGGIEYGYSLPVAKRLNIDFNLGFGYLGGEFKEYLPIDGHYVWQATKRRQFIGPTKAEISLVWQLGRGNINADKGGKR